MTPATTTLSRPRTTTGRPRDESHRAVDRLLVQAAAGDAAAFGAVYDLMSARVFGLCRRLVRDVVEAEDIAQEAFLEVWTKAAAFDPHRGAGTGWILAIAHHRAVDRIRSAEGTRRRDAAWTREADERPVGEPADRLLAAAAADEVRIALAGLSEVRRQAVTYAFFTDHTYEQASRLLGIPLGTFKSRVRDGVRALRPLLGASFSGGPR